MSNKKYGITLDGEEHEVIIAPLGSENYNVTVDGTVYPVTVRTIELDNIVPHIVGLEQESYEWTGEEIRPTVVTDETVTENIDFQVVYSNNIEVGTGNVSIIGIGNYSGDTTLTFTITKTEEVSDVNPGTDDSSNGSETDPSTGDFKNNTDDKSETETNSDGSVDNKSESTDADQTTSSESTTENQTEEVENKDTKSESETVENTEESSSVENESTTSE